jgi:PEGA domain
MNRYIKLLLTSLLALIFIVPAASARPRVIIGGGWGWGPGWGVGWGPGWYGYYPGPYYYGPYGSYYVPGSASGELKFENQPKSALVYVDGGYAGTVGNLKTFRLKAGEHDIELRDPSGHSYYQEHVNILAGKTLKLQPQAQG